jgi:hypothetical protein
MHATARLSRIDFWRIFLFLFCRVVQVKVKKGNSKVALTSMYSRSVSVALLKPCRCWSPAYKFFFFNTKNNLKIFKIIAKAFGFFGVKIIFMISRNNFCKILPRLEIPASYRSSIAGSGPRRQPL